MRSLLWKEWRGQRLVLLGALAFATAAPVLVSAFRSLRTSRTELLADTVLWLALASPLVVWPLTALAAGVVAATAESGRERWALLLSRPVSRTRIWTAKLLASLVPVALVVVANELALRWLLPDEVPALPTWSSNGLLAGFESRAGALGVLGVPGLVCLGLGLGLLFGLLLQRQLNAALAGALVGGGLAIALMWIRARLDYLPRIEAGQLTVDLGVLGVAIVVSSLLALLRGELMSGQRFVWRGVGAAAALVAIALGAVGAHLAWNARGPGSDAVLGGLRSAGGRIAVSVARGDGLWSQTVYSAGPEDDRLRPVAPRMSGPGVPSPDGRRVYFISNGWPGSGRAAGWLRGDRVSLHAYDVEAAAAELLAMTDLPPPELALPPLPSPDGRWVAVEGRRSPPAVAIAGIRNGRPPVHVSACGSFEWDFWDPVRGEFVLACFPEQGALLRWIDPATGETTFDQEVELPPISQPQLSSDPERVLFRAPLTGRMHPRDEMVAGTTRLGLYVLDLPTRSLRTIEPAPGYRVVAAAAAPGVVAWIEHEVRTPPRAGPEPRGRVLVLRAGNESPKTLLETTGIFLSLALDPVGEWLVLGRYGEVDAITEETGNRALRRTALSLIDERRVELRTIGSVVPFLQGNTAWVGRGKLVLLEEPFAPAIVRSNEWFRTLRIVDLTTGEERILRP
jgi:hypothetical protein